VWNGNSSPIDCLCEWREITETFDDCNVAVHRTYVDIPSRRFRIRRRIWVGKESGLSNDLDGAHHLYFVIHESALNFTKCLLQPNIIHIDPKVSEQETKIS